MMETRMPYILALDQGTTSSRAIVFDAQSKVCALAQQPFKQIYPQPGWVEHDPLEIWNTQLACAQQALQRAQVSAAEVAAIGITNQRETTVIWDRATGAPIHNAIVWQDRRTADWCAQQRASGLTDQVQAATGLVLDPYFSASKIVWLLERVPGARARAERGELAFGTIDTWLIWQLTQGKTHATDVSNASRTLLYDIHQGAWSDALLDAFKIPRALLPEVRPSASAYGSSSAAWLGAALPITGVAGDQQAALFGQGCFGPGMVKNTYGTGCFMLMHTGAKAYTSQHGLITTRAAQAGSNPSNPAIQYALEGSVFSAGSAIQWLRDELQIIAEADAVDALAASVPDSGGVVLVPAFTGLGSPYWNADARGALLGITRGTGRGQIARAVLEAIALQSTELLAAMQNDTGLSIAELRVDGGATASPVLMQLQADLLGIPVRRAATQETTALGAAHLAGLGAGVWPDVARLTAMQDASTGTVFEPQTTRDWAEHKLARWRRAVQRSLDWAQTD
jgi:glycerol kinase